MVKGIELKLTRRWLLQLGVGFVLVMLMFLFFMQSIDAYKQGNLTSQVVPEFFQSSALLPILGFLSVISLFLMLLGWRQLNLSSYVLGDDGVEIKEDYLSYSSESRRRILPYTAINAVNRADSWVDRLFGIYVVDVRHAYQPIAYSAFTFFLRRNVFAGNEFSWFFGTDDTRMRLPFGTAQEADQVIEALRMKLAKDSKSHHQA